MTVNDLATKVRVSRVTIMNWESGKHGAQSGISPLYATRLAEALRVQPCMLFGEQSM